MPEYYRFVTLGHVAVLARDENELFDLTRTYSFKRLGSGNYLGRTTAEEKVMFGRNDKTDFAILMTSSNRSRNSTEADILEPISEERALGLAALLKKEQVLKTC